MTLDIIIAVIGVLLAILSYFAGQKTQSNTDVEKRAYFEGEIKAKLDQLIKRFDNMEEKLSKRTAELHQEIDKSIAEHEKRYHSING